MGPHLSCPVCLVSACEDLPPPGCLATEATTDTKGQLGAESSLTIIPLTQSTSRPEPKAGAQWRPKDGSTPSRSLTCPNGPGNFQRRGLHLWHRLETIGDIRVRVWGRQGSGRSLYKKGSLPGGGQVAFEGLREKRTGFASLMWNFPADTIASQTLPPPSGYWGFYFCEVMGMCPELVVPKPGPAP